MLFTDVKKLRSQCFFFNYYYFSSGSWFKTSSVKQLVSSQQCAQCRSFDNQKLFILVSCLMQRKFTFTIAINNYVTYFKSMKGKKLNKKVIKLLDRLQTNWQQLIIWDWKYGVPLKKSFYDFLQSFRVNCIHVDDHILPLEN